MQFRIVDHTRVGSWSFGNSRRCTVAIVQNGQLLLDILAIHGCYIACRVAATTVSIRTESQLKTLYHAGRGLGHLRITTNTGRILGTLVPSQDDMRTADDMVEDTHLRRGRINEI